ncbi:hypothetical protein CRUP_017074, partial [Coryphaenoides rupestris]
MRDYHLGPPPTWQTMPPYPSVEQAPPPPHHHHHQGPPYYHHAPAMHHHPASSSYSAHHHQGPPLVPPPHHDTRFRDKRLPRPFVPSPHDYDMRVDDFLRRTQAVVSSRRQRSDRAPRSGGGEGGASAPSARRGHVMVELMSYQSMRTAHQVREALHGYSVALDEECNGGLQGVEVCDNVDLETENGLSDPPVEFGLNVSSITTNRASGEGSSRKERLLKPLAFNTTNSEMRELAAIISKDIYLHNPNVHWDDIMGLEDAKRLVKEAVVYPIKYPELFTGILSPWKGLLLYGPP